ncbi:hypothetical protein QFZ65_002302 [Arthrobacter sp. B3I9]|uniref:phage tail protein n=1 Tax=Arthrobacter sp. B3I9 TaxID=3042270 RepID=UPI002790EBFC|nr:hypothetical protein [Arthrobacter sp. B3I9]MDQ0850364.1 hypothetical protein [Arthrobacter sp. B3I9]
MATTFQGGPGKVPAQSAGPAVARHAGPARSEVTDALLEGRRRGNPSAGANPRAMLALQRQAGNAAVGALMAAKLKSPGEQAGADIDAALKEIRKNEPAIGTVEKGLKAAQAAGVPVELEGPKPSASALAVTKTGFGPGSVPAKKPVQPPKPVPAVSPLGKAGAAKVAGPAKGRAGGKLPAAPAGGAAATALLVPFALPPDKLLQPPVAPVPVRPEDDAGFAQVAGNIKSVAQSRKAHPPAAAKAQEAQGAALPPTDDVAGQAKAAKVDAMDAQQPGSFDKQAFIAAVKAAIEAKSPKSLEEADEYKKSGKAGEAKGEVKGLVSQGKAGQAKDIEAAAAAPPDQAKAVPKPVTPMAQEQAGTVPAVPAAGAAPKPAPAEQLNLAAGPQQANQEMADAEVSDQQLAQSNEPEFQQGLADKKAAAEHAQTAPAEYRQQEQQVLQQGKAEAGTETAVGVAGMQGAKAAALANLVADKGKTKSKDETRRAEVTAKVQAIFAATEADVKKILDGIDPKVDAAFEKGEARARSAFEAFVEAKMSAFKKDRYGGWLGGYRWLRDKIRGMPPKVNEFYEAGRELYLKEMNGVISNVADIVGTDLTAAKQRIAKGRSEISTYVAGLPASLKKVGAEATKEIGDKFEALESDVNAKQESVVDALATKYVESRKGLDERIEALQAENKGLVDKAIGAIKAIINTIRELAAMLRNVLSRAAGVVGDIIKSPVAFLGNLIDGVKGGILKFKDNILGHLKKGLMGWLFGALSEGGVELPDTFDIKGIIKLLASIFGLTWANIRNRIVKKIGEKAMAAVEKGVEIFQVFASQGVAGLWQMLLEKLGNIKDMILDQVKDFVISKVITAGITWLIGLLNPAAAFIKACKLIYDVVMFFVNNAERIMKFVNTIIDSVADIVRGNVSSVVNKIEEVLGQMVPILIGFLASVIGLGGIGQKIRQIIETLQKPVNKALDFVIKTGLKLAGPIIRGIKGFAGKVKGKVAEGKAYVKGKVEAGKAWVRGKSGGDIGPSIEAGKRLLLAKRATVASVRAGLPALKQHFGLREADLVSVGSLHHIHVQKASGDTPDLPLVHTKADGAEQEAADRVGNVLPDKDQKDSGKYLWAEHVIPAAYVESLLVAGGLGRSADYFEWKKRLHTVLTWRQAHEFKDFNRHNQLGGDLRLARRLIWRAVVEVEAMKRLASTPSQPPVAKKLPRGMEAKVQERLLDRTEQLAKKQTSLARMKLDFYEDTSKVFHRMTTGVISRTHRAVEREFAANAEGREARGVLDKSGNPLKLWPDRSRILYAAEEEMKVITDILRNRGLHFKGQLPSD